MSYNLAPKQTIGQQAENIACQHLQQQGLRLIDRNFQCRVGEIDLVMQDNDTLVFIEVRSRSTQDAYDPIESIGFRKQQRLMRTAMHYLQKKHYLDTYPCRFDVIGITYTASIPHVQWIQHAFSS